VGSRCRVRNHSVERVKLGLAFSCSSNHGLPQANVILMAVYVVA